MIMIIRTAMCTSCSDACNPKKTVTNKLLNTFSSCPLLSGIFQKYTLYTRNFSFHGVCHMAGVTELQKPKASQEKVLLVSLDHHHHYYPYGHRWSTFMCWCVHICV